ncbi:Gfo/Idh/MocA family oxidoreductase [bacterium]|nr:MAG: Gfo/Idh/MocA family oxidoreductase [bacterium]
MIGPSSKARSQPGTLCAMTRVGILGAGGMGAAHARHWSAMPDVELHVYDPLQERAKALPAHAHASEGELRAAVDIVDVCLPTDLHREAAEEALNAGKAVFLEKPIARTLGDAEAISQMAESTGVPLGVGHVVRFFPDYAAAHRIIGDGGIGKPASARLRRGGGAPKGLDGWFMSSERSGGVLLDLAIHDFDWLLWTIGPVTEVLSRTVRRGGDGPDHALTLLKHENGCVSHVESTWMDPGGFRTEIDVAGSEGLVQYDSLREGVALRQSGTPVRTSRPDDPFYRELRSFLEAVRNDTPVPVSAKEAIAALKVSLAAIESDRTGEKVILS